VYSNKFLKFCKTECTNETNEKGAHFFGNKIFFKHEQKKIRSLTEIVLLIFIKENYFRKNQVDFLTRRSKIDFEKKEFAKKKEFGAFHSWVEQTINHK